MLTKEGEHGERDEQEYLFLDEERWPGFMRSDYIEENIGHLVGAVAFIGFCVVGFFWLLLWPILSFYMAPGNSFLDF